MKHQIPFNLVRGVAPTQMWGSHRASVNNTIPSGKKHQLYLSFIVISDENDSDKPRGRRQLHD